MIIIYFKIKISGKIKDKEDYSVAALKVIGSILPADFFNKFRKRELCILIVTPSLRNFFPTVKYIFFKIKLKIENGK